MKSGVFRILYTAMAYPIAIMKLDTATKIEESRTRLVSIVLVISLGRSQCAHHKACYPKRWFLSLAI